MPHDELITSAKEKWRQRVYDRPREIDPDNEHEWQTLAYGFFLGLGFSPAQALELAQEVPL